MIGLHAFLRSAIVILLIYPSITAVLSVLVFLNALSVNSKKLNDQIIDLWTRAAFFLFSIKFHVSGLENFPKGGCLYLFNHASFFDIFGLYRLDPSLRFGAKIELFKIPIFGYAMEKTGTLKIPRDNRQEAIRVYEEAESRARKGERFALSPEGGRAGGERLREFKSGPFIFAIKSKLVIVPVLVKGAEEIWPKGAIIPAARKWSYDLHVEVLEPTDAGQYEIETRSELRDKIYEQMSTAFAKMRN